ncbi:hypothetical protein DLAC_10845 [Tieghemostelium lacteum]|uniref:Autophagy-related protein 2 n=1 Tax=Tieghemostelium lacteum TaxID=361077 RepID=A0A151Z426_TIELA|nr:hypothetical protein DLAC_10845 [Tieghemostelium lacteum]|eukprot:KYQ88667.1 hypothetical protein DLAC_10845 [Tieghemostelium lacteum]
MYHIRIVKFLVKKYFGKYSKYEIDKDKVEVGFKKGTLLLNDFEINSELINKELLNAFPLSMSTGYISSIQTKILSTCEFTLSNLDLNFVYNDDYDNIVVNKIKELDEQWLDQKTENQMNSNSATKSNSKKILEMDQPTYYSDEDEEIDKMQSSKFEKEGLEALSEILKSLIGRIYFKVDKCTITISRFDKYLNKSTILLLVIDSIEMTDLNSNSNSSNSKTNSNDQDYYYKKLQLKNYSILIGEYQGNILKDDRYYQSTIFDIIPYSQFHVIFTNKYPTLPTTTTTSPTFSSSNNNTNTPKWIDEINLKIKRNEKLLNEPMFTIDGQFQNWNLLLNPTTIQLLSKFMINSNDSQSVLSEDIDLSNNNKTNNASTSATTTTTTTTAETSTLSTSFLYSINLNWKSLNVFISKSTNNSSTQQYFSSDLTKSLQSDSLFLQIKDLTISTKESNREKQIELSIQSLTLDTFIYELKQMFPVLIVNNNNNNNNNSTTDNTKYIFVNINIDKYQKELNIKILNNVIMNLDPYTLIFIQQLMSEITSKSTLASKNVHSENILNSSNSKLFNNYNSGDHQNQQNNDDSVDSTEQESITTFISLYCNLITLNIMLPQIEDQQQSLFKSFQLDKSKNFEILIEDLRLNSNMISDISDHKWLVDFNRISSRLYTSSGSKMIVDQFLEIKTKDSNDSANPIPIEITVRGGPFNDSLVSDQHRHFSDYIEDGQEIEEVLDENTYYHYATTPPIPTPTYHQQEQQQCNFNPFSKMDNQQYHKGPYSTFVSVSEGSILGGWPDEAEPEEINFFRHSSIESSKYSVNVIIPYISVDLKKSTYETLVKALSIYPKLLNSAKLTASNIDNNNYDNSLFGFSLFSLSMILNRGELLFSEHASSRYKLSFERLELFNVSQYFGKDIQFITANVKKLDLRGQDFSHNQRDYQPILTKSLNYIASPDESAISAILSFTNDTSNFLDPYIKGKIYSIGIKGLTIHHHLNSNQISNFIEFFTLSSSDDQKQQQQQQSPPPIQNDNNNIKSKKEKDESNVNRYYISFLNSSIYYSSPNLLAVGIIFFNDIKLKWLELTEILSCITQNNYVYIIDNIRHLHGLPTPGMFNFSYSNDSENTASRNVNSSSGGGGGLTGQIDNVNVLGWKSMGFVPIVHSDYIEFELHTKSSILLDYNHNLLSLSACADSFHVLNELLSNFLGLDIPLAEVADLIVSQGITPDLKENIDILINQDNFRSSNDSVTTTNSSSTPTNTTPTPTPTTTTVVQMNNSSNNVPNNSNSLGFDDFDEDKFVDFSDDDQDSDVYEYYSPMDLLSNSKISVVSESTTSLTELNDFNQDTSSQTSIGAPMAGGILIEDYDHDRLDQYQIPKNASLNNIVDNDEFYMDADELLNNQQSPSTPFINNNNNNNNNNISTTKDGSVVWLDQSPNSTSLTKLIEPVENYISNPDEDPEDFELPPNYPKSNLRLIFKRLNISIKIFNGLDWNERVPLSPTSDSSSTPLNKSTGSTTSSSSNIISNNNNANTTFKARDVNHYVELILSNLNLRLDRFNESDQFAKRLSLHINDITVVDHVPSSLWNKFLYSDTNITRYQQSPMIKILFETIRPDLSRPLLQENRLKLLVLPLRFHIDQDTVTFIYDFISYKPKVALSLPSPSSFETINSSSSSSNEIGSTSPPIYTTPHNRKQSQTVSRSIPEDKAQTSEKEAQEITYFQSVEILPIRLKIDYKPKKVDYYSLTTGNYAELLNLLPLEGAVLNLNRLKLNGVGGWSALINQIGKAWIPHIINTQLLGYVSGVRGLNSIIHIGESLANLVILPYEQYKKDGKLFRGLKKGTTTFLKNLTIETLSVGAKVAIGTQGLLEIADNVLSKNSPSSSPSLTQRSLPNTPSSLLNVNNNNNILLNNNSALHSMANSPKLNIITFTPTHSSSKLSDQPMDTREGIQHAYESVSRELKSTVQTIIAIPMKEYHQKGTKGYVKSIVKAVPIAIIRPMIGITEGVSKTLLGVRNHIDPQKKIEMDNKYKSNKK